MAALDFGLTGWTPSSASCSRSQLLSGRKDDARAQQAPASCVPRPPCDLQRHSRRAQPRVLSALVVGSLRVAHHLWRRKRRKAQVLRHASNGTSDKAQEPPSGNSWRGWSVRRRTLEALKTAAASAKLPAGAWPSPGYDWSSSTKDNYGRSVAAKEGSTTKVKRENPFADERSRLDLQYHGVYTPARCALQDTMVDALLNDAKARLGPLGLPLSRIPSSLIFSAGAMGAGKSYSLCWLAEQGLLPALGQCVYVDPDVIARCLPEWEEYRRRQESPPSTVSGHELCLREAGLIAEVAIWAALRQGLSVCVDSSLRDGAWHRRFFQEIHNVHPEHQLILAHIDIAPGEAAPLEILVQRATQRAERTGRKVPVEAIAASAEAVPKAVAEVCDLVDVYIQVLNSQEEGGEPFIAAICDQEACSIFTGAQPDRWKARWALRHSLQSLATCDKIQVHTLTREPLRQRLLSFLASIFVVPFELLGHWAVVGHRRWQRRFLPRRVILVRHAQSRGNVDQQLYSQVPDSRIPLTDEGKEQAERLGRRIRSLVGPHSTSWFFTSPYIRAKQTLKGIMTGLTENAKVKPGQYRFYEDPRLREQDFGNLQVTEQMTQFKLNRKAFGRFFYRFPDGESGADVFDRVTSFWASVRGGLVPNLSNRRADNFVLVTHGLIMRLLCMRIFRWTVTEFEQVWNPDNCEIWVLELRPGTSTYELVTPIRWGADECRSTPPVHCRSIFEDIDEVSTWAESGIGAP